VKKLFKIGIFLFILSAFILSIDTHGSAGTDYSTIRVKISISKTSIPIVVSGSYKIPEAGITISSGSYTISLNNNKVRIQGNGIDKTANNCISLISQAKNNLITIKGTIYGDIKYLGDMVFTADSGTLLVVNRLPLEEYLYGVIAYEMSNSFPLEALKAQAVCARGYATSKIKTSGAYDLVDTTVDQVYKGYEPSYQRVIQAVNETKGQVLTYNGKIISTFYSASNGGQTELPGNIWGGGEAKNREYPYLPQKDDPYDLENPYSLYQIIFVPKTVAGSQYDAPNSGLGEYIVRIVNLTTYCNVRSGPGTNYSIIGSAYLGDTFTWLDSVTNDKGETWHKVNYKGSNGYIISDYAQKMKNDGFIYNHPVLTDLQNRAYEKLKSSGKNIAKATDVKIISVNSLTNGQQRWPGTGSRCYVTANANVTVQYYPEGSSTNLDLVLELMKKTSSGGYSQSHEYLNSNLSMRGVRNAQGGYEITNGRYGHGVGMSQRGAQTMAEKYNKSYQEILAFYFPGTKLTDINSGQQVPGPGDNPEPGKNPTITSSKYTIKNSNITGLSTNLNVSTFLSNISVQNGTVQLVSYDGKAKTSGVLATGDKLQLRYKDSGSIYNTYNIVIYGDVNGDGDITIIDLLRVQKHLLNTSKLSGAFLTAADVSKDGAVTILDLLRVQKHLLGTAYIQQ